MAENKIALLLLCAVLVVGIVGTMISIMPVNTGAATTVAMPERAPELVDYTPRTGAWTTSRTGTWTGVAQNRQYTYEPTRVSPQSTYDLYQSVYKPMYTTKRLSCAPSQTKVDYQGQMAAKSRGWRCTEYIKQIDAYCCSPPVKTRVKKPTCGPYLVKVDYTGKRVAEAAGRSCSGYMPDLDAYCCEAPKKQ